MLKERGVTMGRLLVVEGWVFLEMATFLSRV